MMFNCLYVESIPKPTEQNCLNYPLNSGKLDYDFAGVQYCIAVAVGYCASDNRRSSVETRLFDGSSFPLM